VVLLCCYNMFTVVLQCSIALDSALALSPGVHGVALVSKQCYSGVTVVSQWCYSGVNMELR
jgi:hypothetical protein